MHEVIAKGILSAKNGMNIYRGCSHGCIYCDSRSKCYNMQHDFEDIEIKINAPELLEDALKRKRKKCMIGTGAMCDPYMHIEERKLLTRRCLEIINNYEFGLAIQTKSNRILRDLDLLKEINNKSKCVVQMTLTTYDNELCKILEPDVCTTSERFETLCTMRDNGIKTVVWLTPLLPYINDTKENMQGLLDMCVKAKVHGIIYFNAGLTLREGNREYYYEKLDKHFPGLKQRYIKEYGDSYEIVSKNNYEITKLVRDVCSKNGILYKPNEVFNYLYEYESKNEPEQMTLNI